MRNWLLSLVCIMLGSCTSAPLNEPYERITVQYERVTTADGVIVNVKKSGTDCPRFKIPDLDDTPKAPEITEIQKRDAILVQNMLVDYIKALKAHNALERARWKYQVDEYNKCK